ncbi:uncharacterized protein [Eurosta solidaginis]|uniref:uncharacterized protein isoform X2 n=1 Tax=Eurosta solidaginis TaxID=178769 RepID=UPI00353107B4
MPLNKTQRKPSNETLASLALDSTLDSRMSSAEIPQMELLKVNYVQQCKEARKPRSTTGALQPQRQQPTRHSFVDAPAKYQGYIQSNNIDHKQHANSKLGATNGNKRQSAIVQRPISNNIRAAHQQPLPPPTIESWKFIHQLPQAKSQTQQQQQSCCVDATTHKYHTTAASTQNVAFTAASASITCTRAKDTHDDTEDYADLQSCCTSACNSATQSSCSSDEDTCDGTSTVYHDCEKSNSWNYRARITTCDIRRDIARAGVKSRADRIARIEKTDCAHQLKQGATASSVGLKRLSLPPSTHSAAQMPEVVTQINRLFEQVKQPEQRRSTKQYRAPAPPLLPTVAPVKSTTSAGALPKQPLRLAPIPKKEPNMRMRPRDPLPSIEERVKRFSNSSASGDCLDCVVESRSTAMEEVSLVRNEGVNSQRASPDQQRAQVSRIPKLITEAQQRQSTSSALHYSETNEQLQRRIRQIFDQDEDRRQQLQRQITAEFRMQCTGEKMQLRSTKPTTMLETTDKPMCSSSAKKTDCEERAEDSLLKQTRLQALANFQKLKTERVHIRKKRQPLLIVNQLNESKERNDSRAVAAGGEALGNRADMECTSAQNATKAAQHKSPTDSRRRTCGYKNCNFTNCPISATSNATGSSGNSSASTPQLSDEELNTRKRLSIESCCSDSGVSSSADAKERKTKENNMKNLEKCEDCVKIFLCQGHNEPTIMQQHKLQLSSTAATSKLKDFPNDKLNEGQIKIHVGKATAPSVDPNDVQNFAKKSLTKPTTDELLIAATAKPHNNSNGKKLGDGDKLSNRTTAEAASASNTKQCNIEIDLKNNEQRIYNNTNCNNNKKNIQSGERQPLCATTIKIDDDWVSEQNNCDAYTLMASSSPPPPIIAKTASALQHLHNNANNNNSRGIRSPSGDSDKHSVKIFVRSSTTSAGVDENSTRASSISINSYTSRASESSSHSNSSKSSSSGSSYTTISSGASSNNCKCKCRCRKNDDEFEEVADYFGSLDRMAKSGIFFNRAACMNKSANGARNETIRACAASPTPSTDTFCEVSCVECGEVTCNEEEGVNPRNSIGSVSSGIGSSGGIFWNNAFINEPLPEQNCAVFKNKSPIPTKTLAERDEQEHCGCSLTSCDEDNCSFYECDGGIVVESQPADDDDHCVSRIEVHASVHAPHSSSNSSGGVKKDETRMIASISNNNKNNDDFYSADCVCADKKSTSATEAQIQRIRERERCAAREQQQQEQQWLRQRMRERDCNRQMQFIRNSSAEEMLIRNKKLLRMADVIHELRPRSMDCVIDSTTGLLNGDNTGSSPDSLNHPQNQQDAEARRIHRGHVLTELLETERIYVNEMASILKGYRDQMLSEEMMHLVPASLQGKEDILFGNLHELFTFHNDVFLKDLENCISTTELVALCFVQRRDTFYRLYSFYCQNIPRSDRLRETLVDTHLFLQECQKRLGHKLPLGAYLLKPVQRITKYKLLLENLLSSSDSGSCTKELQKALDCMLIVLRCVNDSMHQVAITGFPSNLSQQGELLLQDPFQVWTESKKDLRLRKKPQQRHIFLYQKSMIFCKKTSKPGHNKSTYQFKHQLKLSQIGLTESVRGDITRFEVWLQGRQEVHTLQATTEDVKNKWVTEIKRLLLNQLEELKGEKIKQYSMSHHGLRQTTSWDTPNILLGMTQRAVSCDASSESSNRNSNCSSSGDDAYPHGMPLTATGNGNAHAHGNGSGGGGVGGAASADKDQQEACGWSSDYSNSEDEMSIIEDSSAPKPIQRVGRPRHIWNRSIENLLEARAAIRNA